MDRQGRENSKETERNVESESSSPKRHVMCIRSPSCASNFPGLTHCNVPDLTIRFQSLQSICLRPFRPHAMCHRNLAKTKQISSKEVSGHSSPHRFGSPVEDVAWTRPLWREREIGRICVSRFSNCGHWACQVTSPTLASCSQLVWRKHSHSVQNSETCDPKAIWNARRDRSVWIPRRYPLCRAPTPKGRSPVLPRPRRKVDRCGLSRRCHSHYVKREHVTVRYGIRSYNVLYPFRSHTFQKWSKFLSRDSGNYVEPVWNQCGIPGPSNYQNKMVVLVSGLFWSFWSVCFYFADSCGFLQSFAGFLRGFCGCFSICVNLRPFAQKTGSMTKTTRKKWSLDGPGLYNDSNRRIVCSTQESRPMVIWPSSVPFLRLSSASQDGNGEWAWQVRNQRNRNATEKTSSDLP